MLKKIRATDGTGQCVGRHADLRKVCLEKRREKKKDNQVKMGLTFRVGIGRQ